MNRPLTDSEPLAVADGLSAYVESCLKVLTPGEIREALGAACEIKEGMTGYCILMPRTRGGRGVFVTGVLNKHHKATNGRLEPSG